MRDIGAVYRRTGKRLKEEEKDKSSSETKEEPEILIVPSSSSGSKPKEEEEETQEEEEEGEEVQEDEAKSSNNSNQHSNNAKYQEKQREVKVVEVKNEKRKNKKERSSYCFPMHRIDRIVRSQASPNHRVTHEAVFLINKASEKFLELFCEDAYACSLGERRNYLGYNHLSSVVSKRRRLDFLSDFVPEKIKAADALAERNSNGF